MDRPAFEVADVFRLYGEAYRRDRPGLPASHRRVMAALTCCRTAALGGHIRLCPSCGHIEEISYNSCRNRHCPKCQSQARRQWLDARLAELLPVPYFHVVFTLPESLTDVALQNGRILYDLLFETVSRTLLTIARDKKHLGADIGFFAILHTWGQALLHHPHLHCVVPAGGLSTDRQRWVACRRGFLLPVRVLSRLFRRLFTGRLRELHDEGRLRLAGSIASLVDPLAFESFLGGLRSCEWVVYAKPPFGGPEHVLRYLGRYTHRVAISNHRILDVADGQVSFRYRDYRRPHEDHVLTLCAEEFIRRFLLHVLPARFVKIRHFGLFANRFRARNIARCRHLLASLGTDLTPPPQVPSDATHPLSSRSASVEGDEGPQLAPTRGCPRCGHPVLLRNELPPERPLRCAQPVVRDTS